MFSIIAWLLFGALVGWVASIIMKTNAQQGALLNIIVGIFGSFIGGYLFNRTPGTFSPMSFLTALVGALLLLGIYNFATRGRVR